MELAMIGLGRMGANMAERLVRGGHTVRGYDPGEAARSWPRPASTTSTAAPAVACGDWRRATA